MKAVEVYTQRPNAVRQRAEETARLRGKERPAPLKEDRKPPPTPDEGEAPPTYDYGDPDAAVACDRVAVDHAELSRQACTGAASGLATASPAHTELVGRAMSGRAHGRALARLSRS